MQSQVITQYKNIVQHIASIIEVSGYRNDYIARKLGMKPQNFSVKKQRGIWSPDEVEKLLTIVDNEDVAEYFDAVMAKACFTGDTVSSTEFEKIIGWK